MQSNKTPSDTITWMFVIHSVYYSDYKSDDDDDDYDYSKPEYRIIFGQKKWVEDRLDCDHHYGVEFVNDTDKIEWLPFDPRAKLTFKTKNTVNLFEIFEDDIFSTAHNMSIKQIKYNCAVTKNLFQTREDANIALFSYYNKVNELHSDCKFGCLTIDKSIDDAEDSEREDYIARQNKINRATAHPMTLRPRKR